MSRPVLVATDLSARCDRAVNRARLLAGQIGAPIVALHVTNEGTSRQSPRHDRLRNELAAQVGNGGAELLLEHDADVPGAIARVASARDAAVIVTGVARLNELRDFVLGTAVDALIRAGDVPVLIVKQPPRAPYRRIVVATDFSEHAREALEITATLFPDAELHAVHAAHAAYETWLNKDATADFMRTEAEGEMRAFLARLPNSARDRVTSHVEIGEVEPALNLAAQSVDANLLVLGTHGRSALAHAALGSRASDILRCLPLDALVVKRGTRR